MFVPDDEVGGLIERIRGDARQRREFLLVVLLLGTALNLAASVVWECLGPCSFAHRAEIVGCIVVVSIAAALFLIHFDPGPPDTWRRVCWYAVEDEGGSLHIELNGGVRTPLLELVSERLDWSRMSGSEVTERIPALLPLLFLDPLMHEFQTAWHHDERFTEGFQKLDDGMYWRQEIAGGAMLALGDLWMAVQSEPLSALFGGERLRRDLRFGSLFTVKLPPNTCIDVPLAAAHPVHLSIENPHVHIDLELTLNSVSVREREGAAIPTAFSVGVEVRTTHKRLGMLRRRSSDYVVWAHRVQRAIQRYCAQKKPQASERAGR